MLIPAAELRGIRNNNIQYQKSNHPQSNPKQQTIRNMQVGQE